MSRFDMLKALNVEDLAYVIDEEFRQCRFCRVPETITEEECETRACVLCIIDWLMEECT